MKTGWIVEVQLRLIPLGANLRLKVEVEAVDHVPENEIVDYGGGWEHVLPTEMCHVLTAGRTIARDLVDPITRNPSEITRLVRPPETSRLYQAKGMTDRLLRD